MTHKFDAQDVFLQINYHGQDAGLLQLEHGAQLVGIERILSSDQMVRDRVGLDFTVLYVLVYLSWEKFIPCTWVFGD